MRLVSYGMANSLNETKVRPRRPGNLVLSLRDQNNVAKPCRRSARYLPDLAEQRPEPGRFRIEMLATLDARERDGAQLAVRFVIMADHAALALETASDRKIDHGADEVEIFLIG